MGKAFTGDETIATCIAILKASGPKSAPELAEIVGMQRTSSNWIKTLLRRHPDISSRHRTIRNARGESSRATSAEYFAKAEYFAYGEFPAEPPSVADLWRGWRNPATGYQPARLGLDQPETTGGA